MAKLQGKFCHNRAIKKHLVLLQCAIQQNTFFSGNLRSRYGVFQTVYLISSKYSVALENNTKCKYDLNSYVSKNNL